MNYNKDSSSILQERYLIALLEDQKIAFPSRLVRDILIIERSQLLVLPFYDPACLGVVYDRDEIIPLVSTKKILGITENKLLQSTLTAVRLNSSAEHLAGVALTVDRMEKSVGADELSRERKFQLTDIPPKIWKPQR